MLVHFKVVSRHNVAESALESRLFTWNGTDIFIRFNRYPHHLDLVLRRVFGGIQMLIHREVILSNDVAQSALQTWWRLVGEADILIGLHHSAHQLMIESGQSGCCLCRLRTRQPGSMQESIDCNKVGWIQIVTEAIYTRTAASC